MIHRSAVNLKRFRQDPDIGSCFVQRDEIGFGVWQYSVWSKRSDCPIGIAWVNVWGGEPCIGQLAHIYVHPYWRRHGVASLMLEKMFEVFDILETGCGSDEGGFALMRKHGWKLDKKYGKWVCIKKKKRGV